MDSSAFWMSTCSATSSRFGRPTCEGRSPTSSFGICDGGSRRCAPEEDFETLAELSEEWDDEAPPSDAGAVPKTDLGAEIAELAAHADLAASITLNAKGQALLVALRQGFEKLSGLGANRKAVIFTESRRTQGYLFELLEGNGYANEVMTLNGTNTDQRSSAIYEAWKATRPSGEAIGNKAVDLRTALVDRFRNHASVMIATEAAAEGVNLQFCALVVNYDLPWNPQRIEQRIGRCHRYGQTHDVVVINFLNRKNEADLRVFQLLSEKFQLFEDVFGASDEVLGALESGVDFERRIADIYQSCRTPEQIGAAFDALQGELEEQIAARLAATRAQLLENFDEDVHRRLRMSLDATTGHLDRLSRALWELTQHELREEAVFEGAGQTFELRKPFGDTPAGSYRLLGAEAVTDASHAYRLGHPLAQHLIARAAVRGLGAPAITFDYTGHRARVSLVDGLVGVSGYLSLTRLTVRALDQEDHLLFAGVTDDGLPVDGETCERLFGIAAQAAGGASIPEEVTAVLRASLGRERDARLTEIGVRNTRFFEEEIEKLERWADDLKNGLEREVRDLDAEIKTARREAKLLGGLDEKVAAQRHVRDLEADRNRKRRALFDAQDEVDRRKEGLITTVEARLRQTVEAETLFTVRWRVI